MIYSKFNQYIKDQFFKTENIGSHVVLSVDKQVIDEFCLKNSISVQQLKDEFRRLFSESWDEAFKPENFFGLIALQVYVAHLMGEIGRYSHQMYNPRLSDILRRDNRQAFYIELLYERYQDQLWFELKDWCNEKGFFIEIPKIGKYKGRYIQYPLSQALLNQDDLSKMPILFAHLGIKPANRIGFNDFQYVIREFEPKDILTAHYFKVKSRLQKYRNGELLDLLYRQVFEYYCNWDGEIPEFEIKQFHGSFNRQELKKMTNILIYNEQDIQLLDSKYSLIEKVEIDTRELFQRIKKHYQLSHPDLIIFRKDDYGDWIETKYLEAGSNNLIILRNENALIYSFKHINAELKIIPYKYYSIVEIEIPSGFIAEGWLGRYLKEKNKLFSLENGLKLDRKTWMFQAGPDIKFEKIVDASLINLEASNNIEKIELLENKLTIKLQSYPPGQYIIAIRHNGKIKFEIKEPTINNFEITKGWQISKRPALWKSSSEPFQICGLVNSFSTEQDSNSEIRDWINANMKEYQKEQNPNKPQITNAINRAKYGIQY